MFVLGVEIINEDIVGLRNIAWAATKNSDNPDNSANSWLLVMALIINQDTDPRSMEVIKEIITDN